MASKRKTDFDVVFDKDGNLLGTSYYYGPTTTEKNKMFPDTLEYAGWLNAKKGGNSRILFKSLNSNRQYCMFINDFDEVVKAKRFIDNLIAGDFTFCRKGQSQGIRLIFDIAP
jgi:hypothetical protein